MSQPPTTPRQTSTLADHVAANIRAELAVRRQTSKDLARVLHIGQRAASRRLSGDLDFSLNELDAVARWLGVARVELMRERALENRADVSAAAESSEAVGVRW